MISRVGHFNKLARGIAIGAAACVGVGMTVAFGEEVVVPALHFIFNQSPFVGAGVPVGAVAGFGTWLSEGDDLASAKEKAVECVKYVAGAAVATGVAGGLVEAGYKMTMGLFR